MRKIVFISDFFVDQVSGGAEIYDSILIEELIKKDYKVCKFNSQEFTVKHFKLYENTGFYFIISNFIGLSNDVKKLLQAYGHKYCILEHDHKYLKNRNPAIFKDFIAPKEYIINRDFYAAAKQVFCQSVKHCEVLKTNLRLLSLV